MEHTPYTVAELESLVRRLDPTKLCFERPASDFDDDAKTDLAVLLATSADPRQRLANIEYLLLLMHQAMGVDRQGYLRSVFLPWVGLQRRTSRNRRRIGREFERLSDMEAYSDEDAEHIAQHIYRPLVADILDPYLTLLTASYEFVAGTFRDIQTSNLSAGERNKVEFLEARIRESGGPADLLSGYDPLVRNALSHPGSEGLIFEPGLVVFRNVKRQASPEITARRWTHDELHRRVLQLLEFLLSVDAAVNVFGFDCMKLIDQDAETSNLMIAIALTSAQRLELRQRSQTWLDAIRSNEAQPIEDRRELLSRLFFRECGVREMPCLSVGFNFDLRALLINVAGAPKAEDDGALLGQMSALIRYCVVAQGIFGPMFDLFVVQPPDDDLVGLAVRMERPPLEDYAAEKAGLIDLLQDGRFRDRNGPLSVEMDETALEAEEDLQVGARFPRRARPVSS